MKDQTNMQAYKNKHYPHLMLRITPNGNQELSGYIRTYEKGVCLEDWEPISKEEWKQNFLSYNSRRTIKDIFNHGLHTSYSFPPNIVIMLLITKAQSLLGPKLFPKI